MKLQRWLWNRFIEPPDERFWTDEAFWVCIDGYEVTRRIRKAGRLTPILILTARDRSNDTIQGIDEASWFAAGDSAAVFYTLRARVGEQDRFMRIAERFRVVAGRLVEIEAVFAPKAS